MLPCVSCRNSASPTECCGPGHRKMHKSLRHGSSSPTRTILRATEERATGICVASPSEGEACGAQMRERWYSRLLALRL